MTPSSGEIFCVRCHRPVAAIRHGARHWMHLLLTLVTGVWVFVWIYVALGPSRLSCPQCEFDITPIDPDGDRPLFRVLVASLVGVCLVAFALHFLT